MNNYEKLMYEKSKRMWIEQDERIHILNYVFYRWFTRGYLRFLLNSLERGGR